MPFGPCARAVLLVLLCAAGAAAQGDVLVVKTAAGPGVDFTSVSAAVSAAADGDTVLVHAGSYAGAIAISGKSLTLVAQADAAVTLTGGVSVAGLDGQQLVSLSGLTLHTLQLNGNAGAVWIDGCTVAGTGSITVPLPFDAVAGHAIVATDCAHVVIARSVVSGGDAWSLQSAYGGEAVRASGSSLWVYDSQFIGGDAMGNTMPFFNVEPGHGIMLTGGQIFAEGSNFVGYVPLYLLSGTPTVWVLDNTMTSVTGFPQLIFGTGNVTQLASEERDFTLDSPVHELGTTTVSLDGEAGDAAFVFVALDVGAIMKTQLHGPLLVTPLLEVLPLGALPTGSASFPAAVPALPAGLETLAVLVQAAFVDTSGAAYLSDPARLVVLGAQF
jgi:hypothetical protein